MVCVPYDSCLCMCMGYLSIHSLLLSGVLGPMQLLCDAMEASSELQPLVRASIVAAEVLLTTINNMLVYVMPVAFLVAWLRVGLQHV